MSEQKYAEYIAEDIQVKKDGHVMMTVDVAKELNRKSHLEKENQKLKELFDNIVADSSIETMFNEDGDRPVGSIFEVDSIYIEELCKLAGYSDLHSYMDSLE